MSTCAASSAPGQLHRKIRRAWTRQKESTR